VFKSSYWN